MDIIRKAEICDIISITNIYNQAISAGNCTCDLESKVLENRMIWYKKHNEKTPIFVYEHEDEILGYSYISAYREGRNAIKSIGEVSFYVDYSHHKKGIGSSLLGFTIKKAVELGYTHLLAIVIECNKNSISLLRKFGFVEWGRFPNIVKIKCSYFSHLYFGLALSDRYIEQ